MNFAMSAFRGLGPAKLGSADMVFLSFVVLLMLPYQLHAEGTGDIFQRLIVVGNGHDLQ